MRNILTKINPMLKFSKDINTPFTDKELKNAIKYFTECNIKITDDVKPAKGLTFFIDKDATTCTISALMTIRMNVKLFVHIYRKMMTLGKSGMCILKALSDAVKDHYYEINEDCRDAYLNFDKDKYIAEFIMSLDNIISPIDINSIIINKFNIKRIFNRVGVYKFYDYFKLAMYDTDIIMGAIPVTSISQNGDAIEKGVINNNMFIENKESLQASYREFIKELIAG